MRKSVADWAYAAGLIDGEGCILLVRVRSKDASTINLRVTVGMHGAPVMQWLKATFGGMVYPQENGVAHWVLRSADQRTFLGGIMPYLKLKKPQAELGLAFLALKPTRTFQTDSEGRRRLDDKTLLMREHLYSLMLEEKDRWRSTPSKLVRIGGTSAG